VTALLCFLLGALLGWLARARDLALEEKRSRALAKVFDRDREE
jgi:hypothetical protein